MDERASARAGAAVSRRFAMSDYASHGRCMCGADDCEACRPGCRRPAEDRDESPECDECGETRGRYHMPGDGVGVYRTITIEEMGGRLLCNGCREARAHCDRCDAVVLNVDYNDDGHCPACAQAVALERCAPEVREAVRLVKLAATFGVDLAAVNFAQLGDMLARAREFDAASRAYLHVDAVELSRRSLETSVALGTAYQGAIVACAIAASSVASMHDRKVRP